MTKYIHILLTVFSLSVLIVSCKKTSVDKYPKDNLKLSIDSSTGTYDIKWEKVYTSDFKKYEVYASSKIDVDITNNLKLVATINDADVTSFNIGNVILDSMQSGSKIYFKVAAVLSDRKIGSNTLVTNSPILFSGSNFAYLSSIPELNKIVLIDNTSFPNNVVLFDVQSLTAKYIPNDIMFPNSVINYGKNANGNYRAITLNGTEFKIINIETSVVDHSYLFGNGNNIDAFALVNGFILINYYSNSLNQYIVEVRKESDFSLVSNFSIQNGTASQFFLSSDNSTFVAFNNFGYSSMFSISNTGLVNLLGSNSLNSSGNIAISPNGSKMVAGAQGQIYNTAMTLIASLTSNSSFGNFSFSQTLNTIAASDVISNAIIIFDANNFQKIKTINLQTGGSASQIFNSVPVFIDNKLYVIGTMFDNVSGAKLVILKK
jgi:hypothetical protein